MTVIPVNNTTSLWVALDAPKSLDNLPKHDGLALGDSTTKDEVTGRSSSFLPFRELNSKL
jgi:hypothetical protein